MKNLTINLEEEIIIINKYRITPNELLFIQSLLILQDDENEDNFKDYIEALYSCGIKVKEILLSLQNKGIILKTYKIPLEGESYDPYIIPLNKNFIKKIYKCSFEMGKELFEEYPQFGIINGSVTPLRTVARHFDSLEDCYTRYGKAIKWNEERHNHILELVKWAKENNILNQSLSSFVINNGWIDLEALKENGNINYDTIKML